MEARATDSMINSRNVPKNRPGCAFDIVVIAASRGGIQALKIVLSALPRDFPIPVAIVQHRGIALPNYQPDVLLPHTTLRVRLARDHERLLAGTVYLAPPNLHLTVGPDLRLALRNGVRIRHLLSAADPLFESAAQAFGRRVLAVVLTGGDYDATQGVRAVKAQGGTIIAQDVASCEDSSMPRSAIRTGCVDYVLPLHEIGPAIRQLAKVNNNAPATKQPVE